MLPLPRLALAALLFAVPLASTPHAQSGVSVEGSPAADDCAEFVSPTQIRSLGRPCGHFIDVRDYGAIPDDGMDDTAAIRAAMAAAVRKTLYIPKGVWNIGATTGTEILLWDNEIQILGDGRHATYLRVSADTPSTIDVIRVDPAYPGSTNAGWSIRNLSINPVTNGVSARHGFHIDLDDISGEVLSQFVMDSVVIGQFTQSAFRMNKGPEGGTPTNIDGFFLSQVSNSFFWGGPSIAAGEGVVHLDNSGDSLWFFNNVGYGPDTTGVAVYTRPVGGAAQQIYADWSITAAGGAFRIVNGMQVKVRNGQFEQSFAYTGATGAMISLEGTTRETEISGINANAHERIDIVAFKGTAARNLVRTSMLNGVTTAAANRHFTFAAGTSQNKAFDNTYYFDGVPTTGYVASDSSGKGQPYSVASITSIYNNAAGRITFEAVHEDSGAGAGPVIDCERRSASAADLDLGCHIRIIGRDTAGGEDIYANLLAQFIDADAGTEDGRWTFATLVNGASTNQLTIQGGAMFGTPMLGMQGTGSVNAAAGYWVNGIPIRSGTGSPEGAVAGVVGSLWLRTDGGANTTLYVKESGTGVTGWVAK